MSIPSFRSPVIVPITPGQIGGMATAHTDTANNLKTALEQMRADAAVLWASLGYVGRIVGTDATAGACVCDGLTVTIPNGTAFLIQGSPVLIAESGAGLSIDLDAYPSQPTLYIYLELSATNTPQVAAIETTPQPALVAAGKPCLGKFTTTEIAATVDDSLASKVRKYTFTTATTPTGDGDGETPANVPTALEQLAWQLAPGDERDAVTVILELLDTLDSALRTAIADGGRRPRETIVDQIVRELAITRQTTLKLSPPDGLRSQSANVLSTVDGIYGDGGHWPDYLETEMTLNPDGTLEP